MGLLATVFATGLSLRHNALLRMEPLRPAPAQSDLLGTLPRTEKTPLDLSIAKAQKGPWVFEVKYFKYTLFYPNPAPSKQRQTWGEI